MQHYYLYFHVLLNYFATNVHLGDEGVIDKLMSIARSMVISNNAQYTRVSTRTCQLIIAIASNSEAVYPYHLVSVINCKIIVIFCKFVLKMNLKSLCLFKGG